MPHGNGFGVTFVPGQGEQNGQNGPGRPGGVNPVQSAIQMLSLRLPRLGGAQGLAPGPLLQAPGGGGMPGGGLGGGVAANPLLQALLHLAGLFGGQGGGLGAPALPMGGVTGGAPLPRIIPGEYSRNPMTIPSPGGAPGAPTPVTLTPNQPPGDIPTIGGNPTRVRPGPPVVNYPGFGAAETVPSIARNPRLWQPGPVARRGPFVPDF